MSRFVVEPDDQFDDQFLVVELSEDPERNGQVVGYTTGLEASDNAQEIADTINRTGHQPSAGKAGGLGYTRYPGEDW